MSSPRVTAIVVTYNSEAQLGGCLDCLAAVRERVGCAVVVVDNASSDGSVQRARARPWVQVLAAGANLGYGRGNNRGIALAQTPYALLLNPDARVPAEVVDAMVRFLDQHPEVGIAGPAIADPDHGLQPAFRFPTPGRYLREALGRLGGGASLAVPIAGRRCRVDWLSGACLLVRTDLLDRLGGFDPRFFLYFEETDLCLRAARLGQQTWALGDLTASHARGASAADTGRPLWEGCIAEHWFPSRLYYLGKHHGPVLAAATEVLELALFSVRELLRWALRRGDLGRLRLRWRSPILRRPLAVDDPLPPRARAAETIPARAETP